MQKEAAQNERCDRHTENEIEKHHRPAAQGPEIALRIIRDGQKKSARAADPFEMIEADARELRERNGENGEIDAADTEAEGQEADHGPACDRDQDREQGADPWR